jgi:hypothetical protein
MRKSNICCRCGEPNQVSAGVQPIAYSQHHTHSILENTVVTARTSDFKVNNVLYSAFGKSLCTYKRWWKWCQRASIQAWTRLILFANNFCRSAFGKSVCTYKRLWKWCQRASIQAWTRLILFANNFCRSAFGKSVCTYKRCWKWCPRSSIVRTTVSKNWTKQLHTLPV